MTLFHFCDAFFQFAPLTLQTYYFPIFLFYHFMQIMLSKLQLFYLFLHSLYFLLHLFLLFLYPIGILLIFLLSFSHNFFKISYLAFQVRNYCIFLAYLLTTNDSFLIFFRQLQLDLVQLVGKTIFSEFSFFYGFHHSFHNFRVFV